MRSAQTIAKFKVKDYKIGSNTVQVESSYIILISHFLEMLQLFLRSIIQINKHKKDTIVYGFNETLGFPSRSGCSCSCRNWRYIYEDRGEREKLFLTNVCGSLQMRKVPQKNCKLSHLTVSIVF